MFESIVKEYLESTACKDWKIISILEHVKLKSNNISVDIIETLKTEINAVLQSIRDSQNVHIHENTKNKARKFLSCFDKLFSSVDVKNFIDELELANERREFLTTVLRNVASANTLQTLKVSFKAT